MATVKPATKNLVFKNLLGQNLPVRHHLYKNLLGLKFEKVLIFQKPFVFGDKDALSLQLQEVLMNSMRSLDTRKRTYQ